MLEWLANKLPTSLVVAIWRRLPKSPKLRRFVVKQANVKFLAGILGLVYAENGDILIVKHTYKPIPWGLPSGALKRERPVDGLTREIREETGFEITGQTVVDVLFDPVLTELAVVIKARLLGGMFVPCPEVSDFKFISPTGDLSMLPPFQREIIEKYHLVNK